MIVTPASLVHNWKREIQKWLGPHRLRPEIVLASNKKALVKTKIENFVRGNGKVKPALIVSYEMFVKIAPLMKSLSKSLLICDEGHRLKSSGTWCSSAKRENFNHFYFSCLCYVPQITRIPLVLLTHVVQENHSKINTRMHTLS